MKKILLLLCLLTLTINVQAQLSLTPAQNQAIDKKIEEQVAAFKIKLAGLKRPALYTEFSIDTFKVEHLMSERLKIVFTTADMTNSTYDAATGYDALLNKYYKKLLALLKDADKQVLIATQKNWLTFRDSEAKLIYLISTEKYTGGTMQRPIEAEQYMELVKKRTCDIFEHYTRIANQ